MMAAATRWCLADKPTAEKHIWVDAAPAEVWRLVADVEFMTTLSDELHAVEWIAPAAGPELGAAFCGHNRSGAVEWSTVSYVMEYQPERIFAWAVQDRLVPNSMWRFELRPERGGTLLTQSVQLGLGPSGISAAIEAHPERERSIVAARLRQFKHGMAHNLDAIKTLAEATAAAAH